MRLRRNLAAGWAVAAAGLLAACGSGPTATQRGDRLMGEGKTSAAIAEYKLGLRQGGDRRQLLPRIAQAYAAEGNVNESLGYYRRLIPEDSAMRYQMASDFLQAAREAGTERGTQNMARVLEPLAREGVGMISPDLRARLGSYYWTQGRYADALPLYLALGDSAIDAEPQLLFRIGRAYEELGGCREALGYFDRYLEKVRDPARRIAGVDWHQGSCLYSVAQEEWKGGRSAAALEHVSRLIDLGVPRTLMDQAYYMKGELLLAKGDHEGALQAYQQVLRLNPARTGPLVQLAEARIREIRYR